MAKEIFHKDEARGKILKGINKLADAAMVTLGPRGRNVVIADNFTTRVTKDGVSVVKAIDLEDPVENAGVQICKQAATKTNDQVGDGTTTATIMARSIVQEGLRSVVTGASPIEIKRGIDLALEVAITSLKEQSRPVKTREEIEQVATISANGDQKVGAMIASAMEKVGKDGVITISESKTAETRVEYVEGMEFDRGVISPYFLAGNKKMELEFENCYILITDKSLGNLKEVLPIFTAVSESGKPLLVIAKDTEGDVLGTLILSMAKRSFKAISVKAPGFGDESKKRLEDIAILTGGNVISEDKGNKLESITLDDLGQAGKVKVTKDSTLIMKGAGKKSAIEERIDQIKHELGSSTSEYEREKLEERLGKLAGGLAVLEVGAPTEVELQENKDRMVDALNATKAAVAEGIVPGGGVALIRTIKKVEKLIKDPSIKNSDQITGIKIFLKALSAPLFYIASNAGYEGAVVVREVMSGSKDFGFNAATGQYENLMNTGVVDPTKVARNALINSASVASMVLITDCVVAEKKEDKAEATSPHAMPGGGMPGMM
ncbi:MAG: chaperonin GroEL [Bacteroidota bacterium]